MAEPKNLSAEIASCLQVLAKNKYVAVNDCQTPLRISPVVGSSELASFRVIFSCCEENEEEGPQEYEDLYEITVTRKHLVKA